MTSTREALLLEMNRRNLQLVNQKAPPNGTGRTNETSGNGSGILGADAIVCDAQFFQVAVFLQRVHQHLATQDADVVLPQIHHVQGCVAHEPLCRTQNKETKRNTHEISYIHRSIMKYAAPTPYIRKRLNAGRLNEVEREI